MGVHRSSHGMYKIKPGLIGDNAPKSDPVATGRAGVSGQTGATMKEARGRKINDRDKGFIGAEMGEASSTASRSRSANDAATRQELAQGMKMVNTRVAPMDRAQSLTTNPGHTVAERRKKR